MKPRILAALLTIACFASANEFEKMQDLSATSAIIALPEPKISPEPIVPQKGLLYFRTTVGGETSNISPGVGVGYRRSAGNGAVDLSASFLGKKRANYYTWAFPKIAYFHYFSPNQERSLYAGGGMAWGGIYSDHDHFYGLVPSATLGMEFLRTSTCRAFTELTVSQPAFEALRKGPFPGPSADFSVGIGF